MARWACTPKSSRSSISRRNWRGESSTHNSCGSTPPQKTAQELLQARIKEIKGRGGTPQEIYRNVADEYRYTGNTRTADSIIGYMARKKELCDTRRDIPRVLYSTDQNHGFARRT